MRFSTLLVAAFFNTLPSYALVASNHTLPIAVKRASSSVNSNGRSNTVVRPENKTMLVNAPSGIILTDDQILESKLAIEALVKRLGELALTAGDLQVVHGETIPGFSFSMTLLRIMEHLMSIDWHAVLRGEVDWMSHFDDIHRHFREHHMHFPEEIKRLIALLERILTPPKHHDFDRRPAPPPPPHAARPMPESETSYTGPSPINPEAEAAFPVEEAVPEPATPVLMPIEEGFVTEEEVVTEGAEEVYLEEEVNAVTPPSAENSVQDNVPAVV